MDLVIYRGFPSAHAFTAFTIELSRFHLPGGSYLELTISMQDTDDIWALAMATVANRIKDQCSFHCGDTIDFGCHISSGSSMSAFVVSHPAHVSEEQRTIAIGDRSVELMELVPIYQEERAWLRGDGTLQGFLGKSPRESLMNPRRSPLL